MNEPVIEHQTIQGLETGVCVVGDGRPVLALHGWGANLQTFWPIAQQLAPRGYTVHLLDLPGFGETARPPEPWSVADYMRFVLGYLDANALDRVDLLAHSFGGRISLMLAAEHPDRVRKMVLADSAGLRAPLGMRQRLRHVVVRVVRQGLDRLGMDGLRENLQQQYNARYASEDYLNAGPLRETFVRVIEQDLTDYARRVQASTVLIWGEHDMDTPLWQGQRLEQLIPDAGLIVFEGAGHYAYLDQLDNYVRIVHHFLSES